VDTGPIGTLVLNFTLTGALTFAPGAGEMIATLCGPLVLTASLPLLPEAPAGAPPHAAAVIATAPAAMPTRRFRRTWSSLVARIVLPVLRAEPSGGIQADFFTATESLERCLPYYGVWSVTDESLLAGMATGDTEAAAAFVRRFQHRVFGLARTIVGDAAVAEEVAQEAFIRAWRHAAVYDPRRGRVATWLLTITRNLAIDAVRLRREEPIDPSRLVLWLLAGEAENGPPEGVSGPTEEIREALRCLPLDQAQAVTLTVFYGLTAKEVAELLDVPLGTAKTRTRRGLAKLRERPGVPDE
jgi:RNA polymerase sigma-70 factor (ECF subfamily)